MQNQLATVMALRPLVDDKRTYNREWTSETKIEMGYEDK